ncbi:MAG: nuclear transport factor 2 family protein [Bacteroidota bacterium]
MASTHETAEPAVPLPDAPEAVPNVLPLNAMRFVTLLTLLVLALPASAQDHAGHDDPEAAVRATVQSLFDGMRTKDTTAVRAAFHPDGRLMTSMMQDGEPNVVETPIDAFVSALAASTVVWDERVDDGYDVRVDDGLATAWVPYEFWAGETFSHCGVNAMIFARTSRGWEIVQVMDTRRPACV